MYLSFLQGQSFTISRCQYRHQFQQGGNNRAKKFHQASTAPNDNPKLTGTQFVVSASTLSASICLRTILLYTTASAARHRIRHRQLLCSPQCTPNMSQECMAHTPHLTPPRHVQEHASARCPRRANQRCRRLHHPQQQAQQAVPHNGRCCG